MKKYILSIYTTFLLLSVQAQVLAAPSHDAAGGHHGNPGPDLGTLYKAINLVIFLSLLFVLLKKPVKSFFADRSTGIKTLIDQAGISYQEALKTNQEIKSRLETLEKQKSDMLSEFKAEAEEEKARLLDQAKKMTERLQSDAKMMAESEVKKAREELREMAISLSRAMAEKKVATDLSAEGHARLTRGYLERLKKLH